MTYFGLAHDHSLEKDANDNWLAHLENPATCHYWYAPCQRPLPCHQMLTEAKFLELAHPRGIAAARPCQRPHSFHQMLTEDRFLDLAQPCGIATLLYWLFSSSSSNACRISYNLPPLCVLSFLNSVLDPQFQFQSFSLLNFIL